MALNVTQFCDGLKSAVCLHRRSENCGASKLRTLMHGSGVAEHRMSGGDKMNKDSVLTPNKKPTQLLLEQLLGGQSITDFFLENRSDIYDLPLCEYLKAIITIKKRTSASLIRESGINRRYFYDILSGKRQPDQDYVLRIMIALHATIHDTQWLLKAANYPQLYVRNRRDAIILYSIEHKLTVKQCNEMLTRLGLEEI